MTAMTKVLLIPESAMKYFRMTGSIGGKKCAARYTKEQRQAWGKLGGRPRKDGTRPGSARSKH
jgi:hypothetical protein